MKKGLIIGIIVVAACCAVAFGVYHQMLRTAQMRAALAIYAKESVGGAEPALQIKQDIDSLYRGSPYPLLRGFLRLIFGILAQKPFMGQLYNNEVCLIPVCDWHRQWHMPIN